MTIVIPGKKALDQIVAELKEKSPKTPQESLDDIASNIAWNINHSARPIDWGPKPKSFSRAVYTFGYESEMKALGLVDENGLLTDKAKKLYTELYEWYDWDDQLL